MPHADLVELSGALTRVLAALAFETSLVAAYGFGSVFQDRSIAESDIDIGLLFDRDATDEARRLDLAARIHTELQRVSPREVDLVVLNDAPPVLADRVIRNGRLLFGEDDRRRVAFEQRSMIEYLDFLPVLEAYDRALLARASEGRFGA